MAAAEPVPRHVSLTNKTISANFNFNGTSTSTGAPPYTSGGMNGVTVERLQREVSRWKSEAEGTHETCAIKEAQIIALTHDLEYEKRKARDARNNHFKVGESYKQLSAQLAADTESHNTAIAALQQESDALKKALHDQTTATGSARQDAATGNQDVATLQNQLAMMTQARDTLQTANNQLLGENERLNGELMQTAGEKDAMMSEGHTLWTEHGNLMVDQTALIEVNQDLNRRLEAMQSTCDRAIQERNRLWTQVNQASMTSDASEPQRSNRDSGNFNNVSLSTELKQADDMEVDEDDEALYAWPTPPLLKSAGTQTEAPSPPLEEIGARTTINITPIAHVAPVAPVAPVPPAAPVAPVVPVTPSTPSTSFTFATPVAPITTVPSATAAVNPTMFTIPTFSFGPNSVGTGSAPPSPSTFTSSPSDASNVDDRDAPSLSRKRVPGKITRRAPPRFKDAITQTDDPETPSVTNAGTQAGNRHKWDTRLIIHTAVNIAPIAPVAPVAPTAQTSNTPTISARQAQIRRWQLRRRRDFGTQTDGSPAVPQASNGLGDTGGGAETTNAQVSNTPVNFAFSPFRTIMNITPISPTAPTALGNTPVHNAGTQTEPIAPVAPVIDTAPITVTASPITTPRPRSWLKTFFYGLLLFLPIFLALDYQHLASVRHAWLDGNESTRAVAYGALHSATTYEMISGPGHIPFGNVVIRIFGLLVDAFRFGVGSQKGQTIPGARGTEGLEYDVEGWLGIGRSLLG